MFQLLGIQRVAFVLVAELKQLVYLGLATQLLSEWSFRIGIRLWLGIRIKGSFGFSHTNISLGRRVPASIAFEPELVPEPMLTTRGVKLNDKMPKRSCNTHTQSHNHTMINIDWGKRTQLRLDTTTEIIALYLRLTKRQVHRNAKWQCRYGHTPTSTHQVTKSETSTPEVRFSF